MIKSWLIIGSYDIHVFQVRCRKIRYINLRREARCLESVHMQGYTTLHSSSIIMFRSVSSNCLKCPTFHAGKCAGTLKRLMATETSQIARKDKKEGDISSVFSTFSGRKSPPLPERFRDLKRNLTTGFEEQIQKSWDELVEVLKIRTEEVATKREAVRTFHKIS